MKTPTKTIVVSKEITTSKRWSNGEDGERSYLELIELLFEPIEKEEDKGFRIEDHIISNIEFDESEIEGDITEKIKMMALNLADLMPLKSDIVIFLDGFDPLHVSVILYFWTYHLLPSYFEDVRKDDWKYGVVCRIPYLGYLVTGNRENSPFDNSRIDLEDLFENIKSLLESPLEDPILLCGPTGCGKTSFAQFITDTIFYGKSKKLFTRNLAAIPKELYNSSLHGHKRGAFTGAKDEDGIYKKAEGNILLLDELEGLNDEQQIALLNDFTPRGTVIRRPMNLDEEEIELSVIFATNANIAEEIKNGRIRKDFIYRMTQMIELKSLKEKLKNDNEKLLIFLLFFAMRKRRSLEDYIKSKMGGNSTHQKDSQNRTKLRDTFFEGIHRNDFGKYALSISKDDIISKNVEKQKLLDFSWKGNFRQIETLSAKLIRRYDNNDKPCLEVFDWNVIKEFIKLQKLVEDESTDPEDKVSVNFPRGKKIDQMEPPIREMYKNLIFTALKRSGNNRTKASNMLGIQVRTLNNKINEFGITQAEIDSNE